MTLTFSTTTQTPIPNSTNLGSSHTFNPGAPVYIYTSGVNPVAPTMNLSQNPLEATAQLLINSSPENMMEICAEQGPVHNFFTKITQLLGIAEAKSAENQSPALNQLSAIIQQARPDYKALKQEVSQALEAKSQGRESPNWSVAQAINRTLGFFTDEINASASLMHFLETDSKKETLAKVATAIAYQSQLMSRVYAQLQTTQSFQALHQQANASNLHIALTNLQIATASFGAPQEVAEMMQKISSAVIQMIQSIKQAGETFDSQMGHANPTSKPASVAVPNPSMN